MRYLIEIKKILNQLHPLPIFIFFIVLTVFVTSNSIDNVNPASRFLTMESLVENRSFTINEKHQYTCDKMFRDGNYYSSKPPVLSVAGAGIYFVLHNFFNLDLPDKPYINAENLSVYLIILILVGGTYLLLLLYFYKILKLLKIKKEYQILLLLGLGCGTLYLSYLPTLNNHTIAGSFLFAGFYYLLKLKSGEAKKYKKNIILCGFFTSLSAVIDLPTGLTFLTLFCIYIFFIISKKQTVYYIFAAAPIITAHLFLNLQITGDFLPVQFHPELGDYKNLIWNMLGSDGIPHQQNSLVYVFNIFFGARGLLFYSPILIFAFYSIYKTVKCRKNIFWKEAILVLSGFIIISLFYIIKVKDYAGYSYGFRWFVAITPLLYFFIIFLLNKKMSFEFKNSFVIILIVSISVSIIGLCNSWSRTHTFIAVSSEKTIVVHSPLLNNLIFIFNKF
ncbi:MAG: hypothetical protein U9O66_01075 [Patescibacteria group bacterium]|nr:hypothetical protein [Patescibacteria group bacterium]